MRTVAFVGFSKISNEPAYSLPKSTEAWVGTFGHKFGWRVDRLFEIHARELLDEPNWLKDEIRLQHLDYLRQPHTIPIYMQKHYPEFPASVPYPLVDALRLTNNRKRLRSSFDFMCALAILENVDRVEIYGFDMDYETEYRYQKPSALYWIGRMEGGGIDVDIDENSTLFPDTLIYGYEASQMVGRHIIEAHLKRYKKQRENSIATMHKYEGIFHERNKQGKDTSTAAAKAIQFENQAAMADGAVKALQNLIDVCDLEEKYQDWFSDNGDGIPEEAAKVLV